MISVRPAGQPNVSQNLEHCQFLGHHKCQTLHDGSTHWAEELTHLWQVSVCKPLSNIAKDVLGCCGVLFSNLTSNSRPVYFFVTDDSVVTLSSQWVMSKTSKWRPKGWVTRGHWNWFSWYSITFGSWILVCLINWDKARESYLETAQQMGNGMTGEFLCFAGLPFWCLKAMCTWMAPTSIFVQTSFWLALKKQSSCPSSSHTNAGLWVKQSGSVSF